MERYKNLGRFEGKPSSVFAYELGDGCIEIVFNKDKRGNYWKYFYSSDRVGVHNMVKMHELAQKGKGLLSFIMMNDRIKNGYDKDKKEIYYPDWE